MVILRSILSDLGDVFCHLNEGQNYCSNAREQDGDPVPKTLDLVCECDG
jgi:hypothetical protein